MILRRTVRFVLTLFVVSILSAFMINLLPGNPVYAIAGTQDIYSKPNLERIEHELHLDQPVEKRYIEWLSGAVRGNLGRSYRTQQPVANELVRRLPVTVELMVVAEIFAICFALLIAPIAAYKRSSLFDQSSTAVTFSLLSLPTFILGLLLIYLFAVQWQVLPANGWTPLQNDVGQNLRSVILPAITLAAAEAAIYTRLLRAEMVQTLQEDYILVAYAKGLRRWRVLLRHALRPSSLPLITVAGLSVGALIGGSVIVETLFTLPGLGQLAINSILGRDYVMLQGLVTLTTFVYVTINYVVDLLYYALDPRIRRGA